jgi:hypothetical protein
MAAAASHTPAPETCFGRRSWEDPIPFHALSNGSFHPEEVRTSKEAEPMAPLNNSRNQDNRSGYPQLPDKCSVAM